MNTNSVIPRFDDRLFEYFGKKVIEGFLKRNNNSRGEFEEALPLNILGLFLVVGTEPFKIILRRNFGKLALSKHRIVVASILYIIWGAILFGISYIEELNEVSQAFIAGSTFYLLFAISILVIGLAECRKAEEKFMRERENFEKIMEHIYRGDNIFIRTESPTITWYIAQPIACFVVTLLLTALPAFINPFLILIGIPLLFTAISFWFNEWFQVKNVHGAQMTLIMREMDKVTKRNEQRRNDKFGSAS